MDKISFTEEQIQEFAEQNESGFDVFINLKTKEQVQLPNLVNSRFIEYDEFQEEASEKVESEWQEVAKIECTDSTEVYNFMTSFVDELEESPLKDQLVQALQNTKPFKRFNHLVHTSELRQQWFDFRTMQYVKRVKSIVNGINDDRF